jgi:predicted RNase H-like nuclease (RuvC/YqgF family)
MNTKNKYKVKLSDRVRPNSEAAPWVVEEIKKLESEDWCRTALEYQEKIKDLEASIENMRAEVNHDAEQEALKQVYESRIADLENISEMRGAEIKNLTKAYVEHNKESEEYRQLVSACGDYLEAINYLGLGEDMVEIFNKLSENGWQGEKKA